MKLNAPTKLAFFIAVILFVIGILFTFVQPLLKLIPSLPIGEILMIAAFIVLALASLIKNF